RPIHRLATSIQRPEEEIKIAVDQADKAKSAQEDLLNLIFGEFYRHHFGFAISLMDSFVLSGSAGFGSRVLFKWKRALAVGYPLKFTRVSRSSRFLKVTLALL